MKHNRPVPGNETGTGTTIAYTSVIANAEYTKHATGTRPDSQATAVPR